MATACGQEKDTKDIVTHHNNVQGTARTPAKQMDGPTVTNFGVGTNP